MMVRQKRRISLCSRFTEITDCSDPGEVPGVCRNVCAVSMPGIEPKPRYERSQFFSLQNCIFAVLLAGIIGAQWAFPVHFVLRNALPRRRHKHAKKRPDNSSEENSKQYLSCSYHSVPPLFQYSNGKNDITFQSSCTIRVHSNESVEIE